MVQSLWLYDGVVCGVLGQLVEVMAVKTITADRAESGGGGELPNNGLADKNSSSPLKCGYLMCLTASLSSWTRISASGQDPDEGCRGWQAPERPGASGH